MELEAAFAFAISNIAAFGDTDVFPSPFERFLFADLHDKARFLLQEMHHNCDSHLASFPPQNFDMLCPVGYTGFRWVTQIDPIWNAYFLGLVVSIADTIEKSRIAEGERVVFSYRFSPNPETKHLFSDSSWFDFKRRSLELAKQYEFVLVTDIADFYPRVYHHRLENELRRLNLKSDIPSRIMKLLSHFSKTVSYGLPVGGPAARILAELVLRPIDLHLHRRQIPFCRYADDFALFVRSKEEAFGAVALLSDKLFNEGLSLQRNKTRILPSKEFIETSRLIHPLDHTENEAMSPEIVLLGLSVRYDPYSPTADRGRRESRLWARGRRGSRLLARGRRRSRLVTDSSYRLLNLAYEGGTPSRLDDTTKLKGFNPTIPSKLEVRYSDPKLERQVENLLEKCKRWLNLDGSTKLLPSRLVDTDTIEVWLPR